MLFDEEEQAVGQHNHQAAVDDEHSGLESPEESRIMV